MTTRKDRTVLGTLYVETTNCEPGKTGENRTKEKVRRCRSSCESDLSLHMATSDSNSDSSPAAWVQIVTPKRGSRDLC